MLAALALLWAALALATDGVFLSPRNLVNLAVQASAVGVMATGMVLVIVARHIDLSVGSVLGFTGMVIAALQVGGGEGGFPIAPLPWPLTLAVGLALAGAIGAWHGAWVAYARVPAFVVTLAGLLIFRGAAWLVSDGRTLAPLEENYTRIGGGIHGAIGAPASWLLAVGIVALLVVSRWNARRGARAADLPTPSLTTDAVAVAVPSIAVLGFAAVANAVTVRGDAALGVPIPVLVLGTVAFCVDVLAKRTRFGRAVFAIGGSPRAAELAGIDVRGTTVRAFALLGVLAGVAAVLTTARLGAGTNSMGTLTELSVIAAAVLGGTSLAGGVGSVGGAVLGALWMQSLENGMVLLDVTSALRQVAIGLILLVAVAADARWRKST
jgi:D-xylose transport system permease protein